MRLIARVLSEVDERWKPLGAEPVRLRLLGSAALMLQTDYERGTKDGDILETADITPPVRAQLLTLAGQRSPLAVKHRMYVEVVAARILFCPQSPVFHAVPDLPLKNFKVEVMDVTDIVVSKLKRLNQNDIDDIKAMAKSRLLDPKRLVSRFEAAIDFLSMSAYAEDFPKCIANLHEVERDILGVPESDIELPEWMR